MPDPADPADASAPPPRQPRRRIRPGVRAPRRADRGRRVLITIVGLIIVLFMSARGIARFVTEVWWFDNLNFGSSFRTTLFTKIGLGVVFGLAGALAVLVNLVAADRLAPRAVSSGPEDLFIVRYRDLMRRRGTRVRLAAAAAFGIISGARPWPNVGVNGCCSVME